MKWLTELRASRTTKMSSGPHGLERDLRCHIGRSNIEQSLSKEAVNDAGRSKKSLHRLGVRS
jgi:hypothetical protein